MNNKIFGYVRVSTKDQKEDRQIAAIKEYCKDNNIELGERDIIIDKESGKDFNRQGYQTLKTQLARQGDTIIIKELDRLGRNMEQIKEEWQDLIKQGINIIVIDTPILNTSNKTDLEKTLISNIVFELLSYMAEKERQKIRQRQREGIEQAQAQGKHLGRPCINWDTLEQGQRDKIKELYPRWKAGEITATKFMEIVELKRNTFYKIIKQYEGLEG
jgi:DNA invertase Pin-like site-specific DNA recombinase